jgi:hypothetical protein
LAAAAEMGLETPQPPTVNKAEASTAAIIFEILVVIVLLVLLFMDTPIFPKELEKNTKEK